MVNEKAIVGIILKVIVTHTSKLYIDFDATERDTNFYDLAVNDIMFCEIVNVTHLGTTTGVNKTVGLKIQSEGATTGAFIPTEYATNYNIQDSDSVELRLISRVRK